MGTAILDDFPYPFSQPMAQELLRVMAMLYRTEREAIALVEQHGIDPLTITPGLSALNLWHELLDKAAVCGVTRRIVAAARAVLPATSPKAPLLDALLAGAAAPVSAEPLDELPFDDSVTVPEALLFFDDLTMPVGRVPNLIATLTALAARAPAVCLIRASNMFGEFFGTGFRIAADLVLTNEHVLYPKGQIASEVHVDFGFDVDADNVNLPAVALRGDVATIQGNKPDDWAVVRVAGMDGAWPILELAAGVVPNTGDLAYILQHPGGQRKRLGFVRNTISDVAERVVHYLTDTEPGSSGAPVFDGKGRLIALHHRGGMPVEVAGKAPVSKNEGMRIDRVYEGLKAVGLLT